MSPTAFEKHMLIVIGIGTLHLTSKLYIHVQCAFNLSLISLSHIRFQCSYSHSWIPADSWAGPGAALVWPVWVWHADPEPYSQWPSCESRDQTRGSGDLTLTLYKRNVITYTNVNIPQTYIRQWGLLGRLVWFVLDGSLVQKPQLIRYSM